MQARSKLLKDSGPSKTVNALLVLSAGEEAINCPSRWLAWTTHQMKHPSRHCWSQSYDTTTQMNIQLKRRRIERKEMMGQPWIHRNTLIDN